MAKKIFMLRDEGVEITGLHALSMDGELAEKVALGRSFDKKIRTVVEPWTAWENQGDIRLDLQLHFCTGNRVLERELEKYLKNIFQNIHNIPEELRKIIKKRLIVELSKDK